MNSARNLLPDFLVIGAGKSGTTSLDNYLKQHPDIFMSLVKEPNFFALEGQAIQQATADEGQFFHYPWSVTSLEKYAELFSAAGPLQLKGETSPMYLYHEDAPQRIKSYVPNVKLVAILRQPAERIYSRYMHLAQENRAPSLDDVFDQTSIWWKRNDLVNEGFYYKHLERYYALFPRENILVLLYDDLIRSQEATLQTIFQFLKVKVIDVDTRLELNPSGLIRNKFLDKLIGKTGVLPAMVSKISPGIYQKLKTNSNFAIRFNNLRKKNLSKPKLDAAMKSKITNEIYREDILSLQKLIGRDLSAWLIG